MATTIESDLLNDAQTAAYLGVKAGTLPVWRCRQSPSIPFYKIGRCVRYRRADLDVYLESCRVVPCEPQAARAGIL